MNGRNLHNKHRSLKLYPLGYEVRSLGNKKIVSIVSVPKVEINRLNEFHTVYFLTDENNRLSI